MRESLLHFLWRTRRFDARNLSTFDGQALEILHPGEYNTDAGPDFFNARIRIGDTIWAGNVEMHIRASEWLLHRHDEDRAYDNVILHVVMSVDKLIELPSGERLPALEMRDRIPPKLMESYQRLESEQAWIPCQGFFRQVPEIIRLNWLDRLLVERLEQKTTYIAETLHTTENHWEETFYRLLARNFGLKVNAEPFEMLARSIPLLILAKHKNKLFQLEALLFGQAGFLEGVFEDDYPKALAKEYRHLRVKYDLTPLSAKQWKFLRLRPANFPTVRLAQFAVLVHQSEHLFSQMLEAETLRELENLFDVEAGEYWQKHYLFDKNAVHQPKLLGRDFVHLLLINTIMPCMFHYGKMKQLPDYQDKALRLMEALPAESNVLLDGWANLGIKARNAYQSQALLHLKTRYCDAKRCLECAVGNAILK